MSATPLSTFHLKKWVQENQHLFNPPFTTNRVLIHDHEFIVMILHGPNTRLDFHVEPGEEFFYQIHGNIELHLRPEHEPRQIVEIREGEVFLCPGGLPHSPRRGADTWGLVIERKRKAGENERFVWFCEKCDNEVLDVTVTQGDIAGQVKSVYNQFNSDTAIRTCKSCGYIFPETPMAERLGFLEKP
jgi:3-hydroxyanthranilate 3,4-dioxygenase